MYTAKPTSINNKDKILRRNKKDMHLKFIVIGDSKVGKTTLVEKYCGYEENSTKNKCNNQLYYQHVVSTPNWSCNLKIFDTAGIVPFIIVYMKNALKHPSFSLLTSL